MGGMLQRGRAALARMAARVGPVAGAVAARIVPAVGWLVARLGHVARAVAARWQARPGERQRRLRRRASVPLPNLYEVHPDVRQATPREIGLRSIDIDEIVGTAVAGAAQRGSDFLPLPAFRSSNWSARWQRILRAIDNLAILPPVDLVRYGGKYWVLDGHNRIAAAHHVGQVEVDANVTELVPPGQNPSERPSNLAAALTGTTAVRAAGRGERLRTMRDDEVPTVRPGDFDGSIATSLATSNLSGASHRPGTTGEAEAARKPGAAGEADARGEGETPGEAVGTEGRPPAST
jgi:hypothetical protein